MARRVLPLALFALLAWAPAALAAAGGGSSGFGGGGGGGFSGGGSSGGGGFSGGSGGSGGGSAGEAGLGLLLTVGGILVFILAVYVVFLLRRAYRRADTASDDARFRFRFRRRGREVELAAAEAAADDHAFAPERVREEAEKLFRAIQAAWSRNDIDRLHELVAPELMKEWELRLADFKRKGWRNTVDVKSLDVAYVGLVNREPDEEDRVVVRVAARLRDVVVTRAKKVITHNDSLGSEHVDLREWWTLGKRDGRWTLLSVEQHEEGEHHMEAELVAAPEHDSRIADQAVTELAVADRVAPGFTVAEVADLDFDGSARDAALDLALADGRFAPDVLEAAARRAVAAWVEAIDGEDAALEAVASPEVVRALLRPDGDRTRVVIRGGRVRAVRITALDAAAAPPRLSLEVDVTGRRYVENRDTAALVAGSKDDETEFTEHWTLALSGPDDAPWQIVEADAGAHPAAA